MRKNIQSIRKAFGNAIRKYRKEGEFILSQEKLCKKINEKLNNEGKFILYQEKLSRIERADSSIIIPNKTIMAIVEICNIPTKISQPYINLMNKGEGFNEYQTPLISIKEHGKLKTKPIHSELQSYQGNYYCYFFSTNSLEPKIIKGYSSFTLDYNNSMCLVELTLYNNGKPIKQYHGQFVFNDHYRKTYIVLIGEQKQEVCFMVLNHFNSTINSNQLNMALALTTSSGSQKRPTMHRVFICRKKLNEKTLKLITPELKLNTDKITISKSNLEHLEEKMQKNIKCEDYNTKYYESVINCIGYIKEHAMKESYYTIDESIIYDSSEITDNRTQRANIVSILRENSNSEYYNKISDTVEEICLNIIDNHND